MIVFAAAGYTVFGEEKEESFLRAEFVDGVAGNLYSKGAGTRRFLC